MEAVGQKFIIAVVAITYNSFRDLGARLKGTHIFRDASCYVKYRIPPPIATMELIDVYPRFALPAAIFFFLALSRDVRVLTIGYAPQ